MITSAILGVAKQVDGMALVQEKNGMTHLLRPGDIIHSDDKIINLSDAPVQIALGAGDVQYVAPHSELDESNLLFANDFTPSSLSDFYAGIFAKGLAPELALDMALARLALMEKEVENIDGSHVVALRASDAMGLVESGYPTRGLGLGTGNEDDRIGFYVLPPEEKETAPRVIFAETTPEPQPEPEPQPQPELTSPSLSNASYSFNENNFLLADGSVLNSLNASGTTPINYGSGGFGSFAWSGAPALVGGDINDLQVDGDQIIWRTQGNQLIGQVDPNGSGSSKGQDIIIITATPGDDSIDYKLVLKGTLDNTPQVGPDGVVLELPFQVTNGSGKTGDGTVTLGVIDATPHGGLVSDVLSEAALPQGTQANSNGEFASGLLDYSFGADGKHPQDPFHWLPSEIVGDLISNKQEVQFKIDGNNLVGYNLRADGTQNTVLIINTDPSVGKGYSVQLFAPIENPNGAPVQITLPFETQDRDGDKSKSELKLTISDDAPLANPDVDKVLGIAGKTTTGNVITAVDNDQTPEKGNLQKDILGADGAKVTEIIGAGGVSAPVNAGTDTVINGEHGVLTIRADGSYNYVVSNDLKEDSSDKFTYTITDSDGSSSTTTLRIDLPVLIVETSIKSVNSEVPSNELYVKEDSSINNPNNAIQINAHVTAGDLLTSLVIDGFKSDWHYDFSGLSGTHSFDQSTGVLTITGIQGNNYSGVIKLEPATKDSDVDHGPLTITANAQDGTDPSQVATAQGQLNVYTDAVADQPIVTITVADGADANTSFQAGETGSLRVQATVGDFSDGSESHRVTTVIPKEFSITAADVAFVIAAGGSVVNNLDGSTTIRMTVLGGSYDQTFTIKANEQVSNINPSTFSVEAKAAETNLSGNENDLTDNTAVANANANVVVANVPTGTIVLGGAAGGDIKFVKEDSLTNDANNQVSINANAGTDTNLTTITVSGFATSGWVYDFNGLDVNGATHTFSAGVLTITLGSNTTSYSGTFGVQPPANSDADLGTLTSVVGLKSTVDPSVTSSASDTVIVNTDAVADTVTVSITVADGADANTSFQAGEAGSARVQASFGDVLDGSEVHSVVVTVPKEFTVTDAAGGVTSAGAGGTTIVTFNNVVGTSFDQTLGIQATSPVTDINPSTFSVQSKAVETNLSGAENDTTDNTAVADASVNVVVANIPKGTIVLGGEAVGDTKFVKEDSVTNDANNQVSINANAGTNTNLTTITVSGFATSGWVYDFTGLSGATGVASFANNTSTTGQIIITLNAGVTTFNGTFGVQPPANSDADLGTLTSVVGLKSIVDPSVTSSASDTVIVNTDAVADAVTVSITVADGADANTSFQAGEAGSARVQASFGDVLDGSEVHSVVVTVPKEFTVTNAAGGVTSAGAGGTTIVTFNNVSGASFDKTLGIQATSPVTDINPSTFSVQSKAVETNLSGVENDLTDNTAVANANANVVVANVPTGTIVLGGAAGGDTKYVKEDSLTNDANNQVSINANAGTDTNLTTIVISGFAASSSGWVYNFTGLSGAAGVASFTNNVGTTGQIIITLNAGVTTFNGTFAVQPPVNSDADLGTLTSVVGLKSTVDPSVTSSASDTVIVNTDAVADQPTVTITVADGADANTSFQAGEAGTAQVQASFGDVVDISEVHSVVVTVPKEFTVTDAAGGVTSAGAGGTTIVTFNNVSGASFDKTLGIQATTPVSNINPSTFSVEAKAVETNLSGNENDLIDNTAVANANANVVVANVPTGTIVLGGAAGGDTKYVKEDSLTNDANNQVSINANAGTDTNLTAIVISGFAASSSGWVYNFSGLNVAGVASITDNSGTTGTVSIILNAGVTTFNGTFGVQPPADSDADLGTLTALVGLVSTIDSAVTSSASDTVIVNTDAVADQPTVTITVADGVDANTSFQAGEAGTAQVQASFGDVVDISEVHSVVVTVPKEFTVTDAAGGVTSAGAGGTTIVTFNNVSGASFDKTLGIQATTPVSNINPSTFSVEAKAVETNLSGNENDLIDNTAVANANANVVVANVPTGTIVLGGAAGGDTKYVKEDSLTNDANNQVSINANAGTDTNLTAIVISGFAASSSGWVYNFSGLNVAGVASITDNSGTTGTVSIILNAGVTTFNGTFGVQPPADSDADLGTLTALVGLVSTIDSAVTSSASDTVIVNTDAVADQPTVTITVADGADANTSFQAGEAGTAQVQASFGDFSDGSEVHSVVVTVPKEFTVTDAAGGVTSAGAGGTTIVTFNNVVGSTFNQTLGIQATTPVSNINPSTFSVEAKAVETNLSGNENDLIDNTAVANANANVVVANVPTGTIVLGGAAGGDTKYVKEDSLTNDANNQVSINANAGTDTNLTTIVISGFAASSSGWVYNFTGLSGAAGVASFTNNVGTTGQIIITLNAGVTTFNGTFAVQPPVNSDADLGTLTSVVGLKSTVDPSVTSSASDTVIVNTDAVADQPTVTITVADGADANTSFQAGEAGTAQVQASFGDFSDGSEVHSVVVTVPKEFTVTDAAGGVTSAGAGGTTIVTFNNVVGSTFNQTLGIQANANVVYTNTGAFTAVASAVETNLSGAEQTTSDNTANATANSSFVINNFPVGGSNNATVDEAAMPSGSSPSLTTEDATGTLNYNFNNDGPAASSPFVWSSAVTFADAEPLDPALATLKSDGVALVWSVSPDGLTITGTKGVGGATVAELVMTDINAKTYAFHLVGNLDHPDLNQTGNNDAINLTFGYTIKDGGGDTATGNIVVKVLDDGPATASATSTITEQEVKTNLMLIFDVSGSMAQTVTVDGVSMTRLQAAKNAITELITEYQALGEVRVQLVTFSSSANIPSADDKWMSPAAAIALVNAQIAGGNTNYDAAVNLVMSTAFNSPGKLTDAINVSYFLSDGVPNPVSSGLTGSEITNWETFLTANDIKSNALGMGAGAVAGPLDAVAYDGTASAQIPSIIVTDMDQLADTLSSLIQTNQVIGSVTYSFGTDGAGTFTWLNGVSDITAVDHDPGDGTFTGLKSEGMAITWSVSGDGLTVTGTRTDGMKVIQLVFDTATKQYTFKLFEQLDHPDAGQVGTDDQIDIKFSYKVTDQDGDTSTNTVTISVSDSGPITPYPDNTVIGNSANGLSTEYLDFVGKTGADQLGTIKFTNPDGSVFTANTALKDVNNVALTSGGVPILMTVSVDSTVLTAKAGAATVFTATLVPGSNSYTIDMNQPIDGPVSLEMASFTNGTPTFLPLNSAGVIQDLLITGGSSTTINSGTIAALTVTSSSRIGVADQYLNGNEVIKLDFVTNVSGSTGSASNIAYTSHYSVNNAGFALTNTQSSSVKSVKVSAFDIETNLQGTNSFTTGTLDTINHVVILATVGTLVFDSNGTQSSHTVIFNGDGTVSVSGLLNTEQVYVSTSDGFNQMVIQNTTSTSNPGISLGDFQMATDPLHISLPVTLSDYDGDGKTGYIDFSVMPTIDGTTGANNITGTEAGEFINGLAGNDVINGLGGNDMIYGGDGNDTLNGGAGSDIIRGGAGNDVINGGTGASTDIDLLDLSDATGAVTLTLGSGSVSAPGLGTDTYSNMEGVIGTNFADSITGSGGNDVIYGGGGADNINLGTLITGGSDTVAYNSVTEGGDTITNFSSGIPGGSNQGDILNLKDILDQGTFSSVFPNIADRTGTNGFNNAYNNGYLLFSSENGGNDTKVSVDLDGAAGAAAPVAIATLTNVAFSTAQTNLTDNIVVG